MDKFKVGDKVKLVRTDGEWSWYEEYLGQMFTIKEIEEDWKGTFAVLEEKGTLMPYLKNLELVEKVYTYEDLKKSPIGTKITFEDGNVFFKDNEYRYINIGGIRINEWLSNLRDNMGQLGKIIKIEEPIYQTVYECKEEILDEAEKRYLRNIVNPFRNKVISICKIKNLSRENKEYIIINIGNENITLPYFKENTMYKGMKLEKEYTLEELGL